MMRTDINNTIYQNRDMFKSLTKNKQDNKTYLSNLNLSNDKVIYYNDENKKKKKKNKIALITAMIGFSTLGIISSLFFGKSGGFKKLKDAHFIDKFTNFMTNTANIKDDIFDRVSKKTKNIPVLGLIDKFGEKLTNIYRKIVYKSLEKEYTSAYNKVIQNSCGEKIEILNFNEYFAKVNSSILEALQNNRISKDILDKNRLKELTEYNFADKLILESEEIKKLSNNTTIPKNANKELQKSIEEFNNTKNKISNVLIPKLRDINAGNAPTDAIFSVVLPLGLAGGAVAMADGKEEKKSIGINLGIPIVTTVISTIIGTIKCYSGIKSIIFGLATGQIATTLAKLADTKLNKENIEKSV